MRSHMEKLALLSESDMGKAVEIKDLKSRLDGAEAQEKKIRGSLSAAQFEGEEREKEIRNAKKDNEKLVKDLKVLLRLQ
jgi:predicted  nucleic acid-binding Zn-ribbon protein